MATMRFLAAALIAASAFCSVAHAQAPVSPSTTITEINTDLPTTGTQQITAATMRTVLGDIVNRYGLVSIDKVPNPWNLCIWGNTINCSVIGTVNPVTGAVLLSTANVGGTSGQIQWNNSGSLAGFTLNGDATINPGTGAITIANTAITAPKLASGAALANIGFTPISTASEGIANGVATLDSSGFVPIGQLPPAITGGLAFQGNWNASTNTGCTDCPLASSVGTVGHYYFVNVSGTTNLNGVNSWTVGDLVLFSSGVWNKIPGSGGGGAVSSVAGLTGAISAPSLLSALSIPAGAFGSLQVNQAGALAGVTMSGDATLNASTGALTIANLAVTNAKMAAGSAVANIGFTPLSPANNLSDVVSASSARTNLGAQAALGFAPFNKAGDTVSGLTTLGSSGGLAGAQLNANFTSVGPTTVSWGFLESNALTPAGAAFHLPFVVQENTSGGGNHSPLTAILNSSAAGAGAQLVGFQGQSTLTAGAGSAFGGNMAAVANAGVTSSAEVVGAEINTTLNANVTRKVGLQIIDAGGSGGGSSFDAGLIIGRGAGSTGYLSGIIFDAGGGSGVKTAGQLIAGPAATVNVGIDFNATTFSSFSIRSPGFDVTGAGQVNAAALNVTGTVTLDGNVLSGAATSSAVTVTCGAGTITTGTLTGTAHYKRLADKTVLMNVDIVVSNPFTGSCTVPTFTLPGGMSAASAATFIGRETAVNGVGVAGTIAVSGVSVGISKTFDNSNPIVAGATFTVGADVFVN